MFLSELKSTLKLAWPVMLGQLSYIAIGVVDSIMVGSLGTTSLAASSLANNMFIIPMVFGIGLSYAIGPLIAIYRGTNDQSSGIRLLQTSLILCFFTGILGFIFSYLSADYMTYLKQDAAVVLEAKPYFSLIGLSFIPMMLYMPFKQYCEGHEHMKAPLYFALSSIPLNAFFNWIFIFGHLGFDAYGLTGAGIGTLLSRVILFLSMAVYVIVNPYFKGINFKTITTLVYDSKIAKRFMKLGVPGGIQYVFEAGAFAASAIIIGTMGKESLAAHQIALNLASISFMLAIGISSASAIRIGHANGIRDFDKAKHIGISSITLATIIMALSGLIFIFFRFDLAIMYISDTEVVQKAAFLLIIAAIFQISDGIQAVCVGLLRGIEDVKQPTFLILIAYWVIGIPMGLLFGIVFEMNEVGIWIGFVAGLSAAAMLLSRRFFMLLKRKKEIYLQPT